MGNMEVISEEVQPLIEQTPGRVFKTAIIKDGRVVIKESRLLQGVNKYSGKTWARFEDIQAKSYVVTGGRIRVFSLPVPVKKGYLRTSYRDITSDELKITLTIGASPFSDVVFQKFRGENTRQLFESYYPMHEGFDPQDGVTPFLNSPTVQDLVLRMFGTKNYRKDLVKAVASPWLGDDWDQRTIQLKVAYAMRGLVPIDWLIQWLRYDGERFFMPFPTREVHPTDIRRVVKTASQGQLRRLLRSEEPAITGLGDIVRGFRETRQVEPNFSLSDVAFGSWGELHNVLSREHRRRSQAPRDISYEGKAGNLPGVYGEYEIKAPRNTLDLARWSGVMSNCISTYGSEAASGHTLLYSVKKNGKMIANMQLQKNTGDIQQLLGPYNCPLDEEDAKAVYKAIHTVWPKARTIGGWQ